MDQIYRIFLINLSAMSSQNLVIFEE